MSLAKPQRITSLVVSTAVVVFTLAALAPASRAEAEPASEPLPSDSVEVERFSDRGRVFDPLMADPSEAQFRLGYMNDYHGNSFLDFVFGGDAALTRWSYPQGKEASLTVRGLVAPRFRFGDSFDLLNTDFQGGLAYGSASGDISWEAYVFHQSSHLGDEVLDSGERAKIDFSFEAARFLISRAWEGFRLYGGPLVKLRMEPDDYDDYVTLQTGAEWWFLKRPQPAYVALDLQSHQGYDWNLDITLQIGMELGDVEKTENRHRIFVEFFTGHSKMGQFFNESESYVLFGVAYYLR